MNSWSPSEHYRSGHIFCLLVFGVLSPVNGRQHPLNLGTQFICYLIDVSTNSGKGCTSAKCRDVQDKEHLSFTEEQRELGLESRKDKGVKEREYSSGGELGATGNSCKADQLFLIRLSLVAGTQPLLTSSRGFFANPPLTASALLALHHWPELSP